MSLTSIILAFAPAIAARFKPNQDVVETLKAERDELLAKVDELESDLAIMTHVADAWRELVERPQRQAQQAQLAQLAQQQMNNQLAAQNMQNAMNSQAYYGGEAPLSLLGLGSQTFGDFCNCVPARHDMFLRG